MLHYITAAVTAIRAATRAREMEHELELDLEAPGSHFLGPEAEVPRKEGPRCVPGWLEQGRKFGAPHLVVWLDETRDVLYPEFTRVCSLDELTSRNGENCQILIGVYNYRRPIQEQLKDGERFHI